MGRTVVSKRDVLRSEINSLIKHFQDEDLKALSPNAKDRENYKRLIDEIQRSTAHNTKTVRLKTDLEQLIPEDINKINRLIADNKQLEKLKLQTKQGAFEIKEDTSTKSIPVQTDNYMSRLLKYIPAEVIALYFFRFPLKYERYA